MVIAAKICVLTREGILFKKCVLSREGVLLKSVLSREAVLLKSVLSREGVLLKSVLSREGVLFREGVLSKDSICLEHMLKIVLPPYTVYQRCMTLILTVHSLK